MSRSVTVIAGIDFGTYSTKILVRERNDQSAKVLQIGHALQQESDSYVWFVTPSLMRIDDQQRLAFGRTAIRETSGTMIGSPKLLLSTGSDRSDIDGITFPHGASADLLMAVYTSRALRLVRKAVTQFYGNDVKVQVNAAAPAKRYGDEMVINRCERILHAAYNSVFSDRPVDIRQRTKLSDVRERFETWLDEQVPSPKSRMYAVLPETMAPLVSLLQNSQTETERMYVAVDVGGGTTEVSACYVHSTGRSLDCFFDEIFRLGASQLSQGDSGKSAEEYAADLAKEIRKLCAKAFLEHGAKNQFMTDRWRELTFVMSGGGVTIEHLEQAIRKEIPFHPYAFGEDGVEFQRSEPVRRLQGSSLDPRVAPILTCAHGLSIPRQKWPPDRRLPHEIPPTDPDDHLDLGPAYHQQNA